MARLKARALGFNLAFLLFLLSFYMRQPLGRGTSIQDGGQMLDIVVVPPVGERLSFKTSQDRIVLSEVIPGTYTVYAYWQGVQVGAQTVGIAQGNAAIDLKLAIDDLTLTICDAFGQTRLENVQVSIDHPNGSRFVVAVKDGVLSVPKLPEGTYTLSAAWVSPYSDRSVSIGSVTSTLSSLNQMAVLRTAVFPVSLEAVDPKGRTVGGLEVGFGRGTGVTNPFGEVGFNLVPAGLHPVTFFSNGSQIGQATIDVGPSSTRFTIQVNLYDLTVRVIGAQGQGLPLATVFVRKEGKLVQTLNADENGIATAIQLVAGDYEVLADYRGFRGSAQVSSSDLVSQKMINIQLAAYAEVLGVTLTFWTFIALIAMVVVLIIAIAVLIVEYSNWRRRTITGRELKPIKGMK